MLLKMRPVFFSLIALLVLQSCNEYQKVLKNSDVKAKYALAEKKYDEGDFRRATNLFEQIAPKYIGKPQGERVLFFYANSQFKTKNYNDASSQLERFVKSYPNSEKVPEASFLEAKSYYKISPRYSLDQTNTDKALQKLQNYINTYPDSDFLEEANTLAQELINAKQKKFFEIGKQFAKLGKSYTFDFSISAITAFDNFVSENPGSIYREEALYYKMLAANNLAMNSTENAKLKRLENAKKAYTDLKKYFPDTKFAKDADAKMSRITKEMESRTKKVETK